MHKTKITPKAITTHDQLRSNQNSDSTLAFISTFSSTTPKF
jgi:hypothetical protein